MVFPYSPEVRFTLTVGGLVVHPDPQDAFDQGLLTVSSNSVQSTDASEFASCVHGRGPRHIPSKANTHSSNHRHLASVIPSVKFQLGSKKSRENKNRTSSKKRRKQDECLLPIIPCNNHDIPHLLPDKFYTYVDAGDVGNPRIDPPHSQKKPNRVLSIRDGDLHVVCDHLPLPDKDLIYRFDEDLVSDILLVPRSQSLHHRECKHDDSITLCSAVDELKRRVKLSQQRGSCSQSVLRSLLKWKGVGVLKIKWGTWPTD